MFGNNNKEGIFYGFLVNSVGLNFTAADTSALIPHTFNICSKSNKEAAIRKINKFYYNQTEPKFSDESLIPGFIDLFTDTFFMHGIQNSIQLHLEHSKSPIYFYKFSMDSKLNIFKNMFPSTAGYEGFIYEYFKFNFIAVLNSQALLILMIFHIYLKFKTYLFQKKVALNTEI